MDNGAPTLLMQAAQSAAHADGVSSNPQQTAAQSRMAPAKKPAKKKGPPLRRGKWTPEEEAYAGRLIQEFKAGLLPLTDGTTLRTFLSKLLNCDPMRISKKFVGSNCIGKQVFRRRTADLNRLTPEQIQKSRAELSELERRFLERVAQTNRVKSNGVENIKKDDALDASGMGGPMNGGMGNQHLNHHNGMGNINNNLMNQLHNGGNNNFINSNNSMQPPNPPWLQPPMGYKHGAGMAMSGGGGMGNRAAAAGRALLGGFGGKSSSNNMGHSNGGNLSSSHDSSAGLLAALQQQASHQSISNLLNGTGGSMAHLANSASTSQNLGGLNNNSSISNMLKGLSRNQLSQFARDRGISSASISNMAERKSSFDALMGLDFQSLQSIDNLANLVQSNSNQNKNVPSSGLQNWSAQPEGNSSSASLSNAARRLASSGNMESLLRSLSSNNVDNSSNNNNNNNNNTNNAQNMDSALNNNSMNGNRNNGNHNKMSGNLQSLLQNIQNTNSMKNLLAGNNSNGNTAASAASLADLLRENSCTGLSALRMQDGLTQRNSSVEDFLNLVADGYIPHQDPAMLSVPLMDHQKAQQGQNGGGGGTGGNRNDLSATALAQQQLLAHAASNPQFASAMSKSFGSLANLTDQNGLKRRFADLEGELASQASIKR